MTKRPFLFIGLASFLSALVCSLTSPLIGVVTVTVTALFAWVLSFLLPRHLSPRITAVVCLAAVIISVSFAVRHTRIVEPLLALDGTTATVTVRVEEKLTNANAYIVRVEDGELETGIRLCFWAGYRQIAPENGDLLTAEMALTAAYDQSRENGNSAKANGVYLYAWPTSDSTLLWEDGSASLSLTDKALYALRDIIHDTLYRRMSFDAAALSEGVLLGYRENLSTTVSEAFRASGVYHLLAVSGMHLTLITGAILQLLQSLRCPRAPRALLAMAATVLFTALCGFTASIVRAGMTVLLMLSGQLFRRRADGLNSLGFAAVVMLLIDPYCVFDLGWQLSFSATAGLLAFMPVWEKEITPRIAQAMPRAAAVAVPLSTAVGVSLCASLTTMPLTALYFGELSSVFLLGNLLCVSASSLLLILNFLSLLTAWLTPLSDVLFTFSEWLCNLLTVCTEWLASLPYASFSIREPFVTVWLFALVAMLVMGYRLLRMRGVVRAAGMMLAVLLVSTVLYQTVYSGVSRIAVASTPTPVFTVKTDAGCGLVFCGDGDAVEEAAILLRRENIRRLDWVLWLNAPSQRAIDLSAFHVPIERLLVSADPAGYASLPDAEAVTVFEDNGVMTFGGNTLTQQQGFYCLSTGNTRVLLAPADGGELKALSDGWHQADILLLSASIPDGLDAHTDAAIAVFCEHDEIEALSQALPEARYTVEGDTLAYLTRGNGDITLRTD